MQRPDGNFVEDGFRIIRGALPAQMSRKLQDSVTATLGALRHEAGYEAFRSAVQERTRRGQTPFETLKPVWRNLVHEGLIQDMFMQQALYAYVTELLGKDLCFQDDPSLTLNLPGLADSRRNYLFKGYHQEVWSGASPHTIQFWTPIFQGDKSGQIVLIRNSHSWGHIPHRNREPVELPADYEEVQTDLEVGDVIIFHSLLLHRSAPIASDGGPRLAIPCLLKNFRFPNESFERYRNWRIFSYSDLSLIDRKLGNHYLSPFRLVDLQAQQQTGGIY